MHHKVVSAKSQFTVEYDTVYNTDLIMTWQKHNIKKVIPDPDPG